MKRTSFLLLWCTLNMWSIPSLALQLDSGQDSPWAEIRKERISTLLPEAMKAAGVEVWMVLCRDNNNDPLARHVGGENAGGEAAFVFTLQHNRFHSRVYSPIGEAMALAELAIHDTVIAVGRAESALTLAASYIQSLKPKRIAVNSSASNALADGLSFTQRQRMERALGKFSKQMVSSEEVVYEWLSVKTDREIKIMQAAAFLTAAWQEEAYATVIPGKTTDADVAAFLKRKMNMHGVEDAWAPDQNPNVNSGTDRGHSHATQRVIQPGDVIQIDFGIKVYGIWVTDIQRFAYVLKPGETQPPDDIQRYWEIAKEGNRRAFEAMKPGVKGYEVDKAQREWMKEQKSAPVMWSTGHPVGYVAHDIGPALGGAQEGRTPSGAQLRPLKIGQVFAFDGFYSWPTPKGMKTISVEEMAVVTAYGPRYLIEPQEELILIKSEQ